MLTEQKEKAITMLIKGDNPTVICKLLGIARSTVYDWQKNDEFNKELEARKKEIVKSGNDFILSKTDKYLEQLNLIAMTSNDDRSKLSALTYLLDRSLGKIAQRFEVEPIEMAKIPSREELESEFAQYRGSVVIDDRFVDDV